MATKDNSYWFTHDCDAADDPKLIALMAKYDMAGYGRWWRLCEALRKCEGYKYNIASKFAYPGLATILKMSVEECKAFIHDCIHEFELLYTDDQHVWSESFLRRMEKWDKKKEVLSERGRKGAEVMHARRAAQAHAGEEPSAPSQTEEEKTMKELRKSYTDMKKDKKTVYTFIYNNHPTFIDPYVDMWNIFATEYSKTTVKVITELRKKHFKARIREKEFNFLELLTKAKGSKMCLEKNWFDFDFLIKNRDGYIKLLEGKYDNEATIAPADPINPAEAKLEQMINK